MSAERLVSWFLQLFAYPICDKIFIFSYLPLSTTANKGPIYIGVGANAARYGLGRDRTDWTEGHLADAGWIGAGHSIFR